MNNVNKLNLALSLVKQAGAPFGLLRSFLQKAKPLFHAVNPANQQGLLKMPKALTAYEAAARNLAKNTQGLGPERIPLIPLKKPVSTPVLKNNKAFFNFEDVLKDRGYFSSMNPQAAAIGIAPLKYKGPVRDYASADLSSILIGAGRNWSNIPFARRPIWSHGNFGVMTTPSRVSGAPLMTSSGAPLMTSKSLPLVEEVMAGPLIKLKKSGIPEHFELPQATGKIYYKPSPANADFARQLIKAHGRHNVIPLNSSNLRKIDKITKGTPEYNYNVESGNLSGQELVDRLPDYNNHYERIVSWIKDMQTKYR